MSKRAKPELKGTTVQVLELFHNGMKVYDIADKMGMKRPSVYGIIWRARKRGEILTPRDKRSPEQRLESQLKKPPMLIGVPKEAMKNVMTMESFNHMTDMAIKGGYANYCEYLVDLAVDAYFKHKKENNNGG